jgi:tetratricopeptide (TPR) repeat protein
MPHRGQEPAALHAKAEHLKAYSAYKDAAAALEKGLGTEAAGSLTNYDAKIALAHCYIMLGRFPEAMTHLGEVYAQTRNDPDLLSLSFWAYVQQIETLRCVQEALGNETEANVGLRLRLVGDGMVWLKDLGLERWSHALLFQKGIALWAIDRKEEALATMEKAYHGCKTGSGPGYSRGTYAWRVAMFSWGLGYIQRGLEVLDEEDGVHVEPVVQVQMLVQRVRLLRSSNPPASLEALEAARRMISLLRYTQHPRIEAFAYGEWAYAAIAVDSFEEAMEAVTRLRDLALRDETINRLFLMREARKALSTVRDLLIENKSNKAWRLMRLAERALQDLDVEATSNSDHPSL